MATRLVIAIRPIATSAKFHTKGSEPIAPNITIASTIRRKISRPAGWLCSMKTRQFSA